MFLEENLARLNKKCNPLGIEFKKEGDIIKILEDPPYILNSNPTLKEELKENYSITFNKTLLWHIGREGVKTLSKKKIKIEPSIDIDELRKNLHEYLGIIKEEKLKKSILEFLSENEFFYEAPGAKIIHHNYKGGLLEHTVQTIKLILSILNEMNTDLIIDKDLIIAGALLHDIGKINCYEYIKGAIDITPIHLKHDHIINGIKLISQKIESEKLDDIIHIIASHHNIPEWGSPVRPISNEAWIIFFIENLSSKLMG